MSRQPCSAGAPAPAEGTNPPSRTRLSNHGGGGSTLVAKKVELSEFSLCNQWLASVLRPESALDAFRCAIGSCVVDRAGLCAAKTPWNAPRALVGRVRVPATIGHARRELAPQAPRIAPQWPQTERAKRQDSFRQPPKRRSTYVKPSCFLKKLLDQGLAEIRRPPPQPLL